MGGRHIAYALIALAGCSFEHGVSPDELGDGGYRDAVGTGLDAAAGTSCYGPTAGAWRVCLGSVPTGSVMLPASLDTDTSSLCLQAQPAGWTAGGQSPACFIVGDAITTTKTVVTGGRPLVLVSSGTISIGSLELESHEGSPATGPGADPSACKPFAAMPKASGDGNGGGAGGSFMTAGGDGGGGNGGEANGGRAAAADASAPSVLRGGCRGQKGAGPSGGDGGHGGGAAYLVAATSIMVTGTINASGAGGSSGNNNKPGGGGGGSGGMLVFYAPLVAVSGTVFANGGGGGGGGDGNGQPGSDPSFAGVVAFGGSPAGGDGYALTVNAGPGGTNDGGGGGGGGGAGYIRSNLSVGSTSPPADLVP